MLDMNSDITQLIALVGMLGAYCAVVGGCLWSVGKSILRASREVRRDRGLQISSPLSD